MAKQRYTSRSKSRQASHSAPGLPEAPRIVAAGPSDLLCTALIVLAGVILYAHTLHVPWYLDDIEAIVDNPKVHDLGLAWRNVFTSRGLALLTFAFNWRFGGQDPVGYHLVNITLHLLTTGLVFLLLKRVFRDSTLLPLLGALIFVAHPLQTQAVTYVVQRMAGLGGLFFFLALYLFVRAWESLRAGNGFSAPSHLGFYGGSLLCGTLAVFTKENTLVLPLALLLFARFFLEQERGWRHLLLYAAPFLLTPAWFVIQYLLVPLLTGEPLQQLVPTNTLASMQHNSPLHYLVTEGSVLWVYIRRLFFPYGQALEHDYPIVASVFTLKSALAFAGLAGLGWLAWRLRKKQPLIAFGIAWFFLTLSVESSVIPLDPLFEHRLYLPMFGFVLVLNGLACLLPWPKAPVLTLAATLLVFAPLTWNRNHLWLDQVAFYEDNLKKAPDSERVLSNLAKYYIDHGRLNEAEILLNKSVQNNPNLLNGYINLLKIYELQGRINESFELAKWGVQMFPSSEKMANYLGLAYYKKGDKNNAFQYFQKAISINPHYALGCANMGRILSEMGRFEESEQFFRRSINENDGDPNAHKDFALILANQNRLHEASSEFSKVLILDPANVDSMFLLGLVSWKLGDQKTASEMLQRLKNHDPEKAVQLELKLAN